MNHVCLVHLGSTYDPCFPIQSSGGDNTAWQGCSTTPLLYFGPEIVPQMSPPTLSSTAVCCNSVDLPTGLGKFEWKPSARRESARWLIPSRRCGNWSSSNFLDVMINRGYSSGCFSRRLWAASCLVVWTHPNKNPSSWVTINPVIGMETIPFLLGRHPPCSLDDLIESTKELPHHEAWWFIYSYFCSWRNKWSKIKNVIKYPHYLVTQWINSSSQAYQ